MKKNKKSILSGLSENNFGRRSGIGKIYIIPEREASNPRSLNSNSEFNCFITQEKISIRSGGVINKILNKVITSIFRMNIIIQFVKFRGDFKIIFVFLQQYLHLFKIIQTCV